MTEGYDAVVAGHLCLDIIPDLSQVNPDQLARMFLPGRLSQVGPATFATGGAVSNTGVALHILGFKTRLMGKVGDDLFGQVVRQTVGSYGHGLADGIAVDGGGRTGYTFIISPPGADRCFLGFPGANATFSAADVDYDVLARARLFHFGYPNLLELMFQQEGAQLAAVYRRAKATGVTTSLDTALPDPFSASGHAPWPAILRRALPCVDLFMPSIEEILSMLRQASYHELCGAAGGPDILPLVTLDLLSDVSAELLDMGVKIVGLKLGQRGLYLRTGDRSAIESLGRARPSDPVAWADQEMWAPCFQVQVVGTTGAGDATIAGFLSGLLRDRPPAEAVTTAVAVGACCVEADDALSGLRPWDATLRRIASGWPRRTADFFLGGWRRDDAHGVWARAKPA